jgi:hypothetical protein
MICLFQQAAPVKLAMRPALPVMAVRTFITPSMPVQKGMLVSPFAQFTVLIDLLTIRSSYL